MKILLVEDDVTLGETLKELLEKNGFEVVWVSDGQSALDTTYYQKFDLWLFDVKVFFRRI
ncbi:response regulator [Nitrosophilus labii]|uniref:response regulator n=1 Tax=Nitrosophilus labii TaxID=2706014 RepID=UPI0018D9C2E6|nr:response regulator [Nitrosophilus labii]